MEGHDAVWTNVSPPRKVTGNKRPDVAAQFLHTYANVDKRSSHTHIQPNRQCSLLLYQGHITIISRSYYYYIKVILLLYQGHILEDALFLQLIYNGWTWKRHIWCEFAG